jgi:sugar phosphate isomerase/epimerase
MALMEITRRNFVKSLSLAALAPPFILGQPAKRLPIAFSTLACPAWDWMKILDFAAAHGFAAVELRGLQGNLDLPSHPVFAASQIAQTKREILAHGLRIACVSSSAHMDESAAVKRAEQSSDAKRFIDLAASLDAPFIRVFGTNPDNEEPVTPSESLKALVASNMKELGDYAAPRNVTVLIESHDNFVTSAPLSDVLRRADSQHVGLLWDAHHTFADGKESPEYTVSQLGKWIRHTHLKDSVPAGKERKYVLTGRGDGPIKRQVAALQKLGYQGFYCFEWEKVWHPELTDPEIAVADYARVISGYLRDAK